MAKIKLAPARAKAAKAPAKTNGASNGAKQDYNCLLYTSPSPRD